MKTMSGTPPNILDCLALPEQSRADLCVTLFLGLGRLRSATRRRLPRQSSRSDATRIAHNKLLAAHAARRLKALSP